MKPRRALGTPPDCQTAEGLYGRLLGEIEPPLLREVLEAVRGNRMAASARLGIHRATLRQKLRRHGLDSDHEET